MALINVDKDLSDATKTLADEAATQFAPIIQATVSQLITELKDLLVGRTVTITIK